MDSAKVDHLLVLMAREACRNPGSFGEPVALERGEPLDSGCAAVWMAARLRAGGLRVRLVAAREEEDGPATYFAEAWHPLAKCWLEVNPLVRKDSLLSRISELELPSPGEECT